MSASFPHSALRRRRWLWIAAGLIIAVIGWSVLRPKKPEEPQWLTAKVRTGDIEDVVLANGVLRANKMVNVGAQVSGQVKALHVRLGEHVRRGQLIAEIDATREQSALRDDTLSLAILREQRKARAAALQQARIGLERQRMMMKEDATSQQELQAAQAQYTSAQSDLAVLDGQLQQAENKLDTARVNLGYTRIVAPMDGVVVAVVTEAGQTLNSVQSVPTVVKLAVLDPMLVEAQISEADVPKVKPGMPAWFTLMGDEVRRYQTQLGSVDPGPTTLGSDSGGSGASAVYYNALLSVPNADGSLRIAMTAKVNIVTGQAKNAVLVPSAALGERGKDGRYAVRVVTSGGKAPQTLSERQVRIGMNNRVDAVVLDGLKPGDEVVIGEAGKDAMPGIGGAGPGE